MEYTQGDWRVADRWNVLAGRRLIANCGGYSSNKESVVEENEANAQLIASAPGLHKELTNIVKRMSFLMYHEHQILDDELRLLCIDARIALARAGG